MKFKGYTVVWCGLCKYPVIVCPVCKNGSCNGSSCGLCHEDFLEFAKVEKQYLRKFFPDADELEEKAKNFPWNL